MKDIKAIFKKSTANGTVSVPPSKSQLHRMIICAAMCEGETRIHNFAHCDDVDKTLDAILQFGAKYEMQGDTLTVWGGGAKQTGKIKCECGDSASTMRFLLPISLALGKESEFSGSKRLIERLGLYKEIFNDIKFSQNSLYIKTRLKAGEYQIRGDISSQYISGFLMALPLMDGDSKITLLKELKSKPYVDMTLSVLKKFKIEIKEEENGYYIFGGQKYMPCDISAEGDWSAAAYLYAYNLFGGNVSVDNVYNDSLQGDRKCLEYFKALQFQNSNIDISDCPDLAPILFAAAVKNGAVFYGTHRLKFKESDRVSCMASELAKFGAQMIQDADSVTVKKCELKKPCTTLCSHNDHRIAMALSLPCSVSGGEIEGAEAVGKSFPNFFDTLKHLEILTKTK